jgi:chemotaxis protein CheD
MENGDFKPKTGGISNTDFLYGVGSRKVKGKASRCGIMQQNLFAAGAEAAVGSAFAKGGGRIMSVGFAVETNGARWLRHVVPGKVGVSGQPDMVFTAVLGPSVVVCIYDPVAKVGGMAHFIFPGGEEYDPHETRFGGQALAVLISELIELGACVTRLEALLYGGAKLHDGRRDIGKRNIEFALSFLAREEIAVVGHGFGGDQVRRVRFSLMTGEAEEVFLSQGLPHETLTFF